MLTSAFFTTIILTIVAFSPSVTAVCAVRLMKYNWPDADTIVRTDNQFVNEEVTFRNEGHEFRIRVLPGCEGKKTYGLIPSQHYALMLIGPYPNLRPIMPIYNDLSEIPPGKASIMI